jgi:hypothetical protein
MVKGGIISHKHFVRDLARGAVGEEVVESFFLEQFGLCSRNVSEKNPDYDLVLDSVSKEMVGPKVVPKKLLKKIFKDVFGYTSKKELSVEVKLDEAAAKLFYTVMFSKKKLEFKVPHVSKYARGLPISIAAAVQSPACIGEFDFKTR